MKVLALLIVAACFAAVCGAIFDWGLDYEEDHDADYRDDEEDTR